MLLCSLVLNPQTTYAYNANSAVNYADTWAKARNPAYTQFSSDCTNFVSQVLRAGDLATNNQWYYNNSSSYSRTWSVADDFKWYIKDIYGATRLSSGWTRLGTYHGSTWLYSYINNAGYVNNSANIPSSGDVVVFYDWEDDGKINHSAYCVGTGAALEDYNIYGDLINQHSNDKKRALWHLDTHNAKRDKTAIYAFQL